MDWRNEAEVSSRSENRRSWAGNSSASTRPTRGRCPPASPPAGTRASTDLPQTPWNFRTLSTGFGIQKPGPTPECFPAPWRTFRPEPEVDPETRYCSRSGRSCFCAEVRVWGLLQLPILLLLREAKSFYSEEAKVCGPEVKNGPTLPIWFSQMSISLSTHRSGRDRWIGFRKSSEEEPSDTLTVCGESRMERPGVSYTGSSNLKIQGFRPPSCWRAFRVLSDALSLFFPALCEMVIMAGSKENFLLNFTSGEQFAPCNQENCVFLWASTLNNHIPLSFLQLLSRSTPRQKCSSHETAKTKSPESRCSCIFLDWLENSFHLKSILLTKKSQFASWQILTSFWVLKFGPLAQALGIASLAFICSTRP